MAATPKVVTDGSSDLDEAVLNLFVNGLKSQVKVQYFHMDFNASTNTPSISSTFSNDGEIVTGDLSQSGSNWIDVVMSGFSTKPVIVATLSQCSATNVFNVMALATSSTAAQIWFTDDDYSTAVDPNGDVGVNILMIGY
jgi:hypothetical protein